VGEKKDPRTRRVSLELMDERMVIFQPYPAGGFRLVMDRIHWSDLGQPLRLTVTLEPDQ
jgi:hypothetical protein